MQNLCDGISLAAVLRLQAGHLGGGLPLSLPRLDEDPLSAPLLLGLGPEQERLQEPHLRRPRAAGLGPGLRQHLHVSRRVPGIEPGRSQLLLLGAARGLRGNPLTLHGFAERSRIQLKLVQWRAF